MLGQVDRRQDLAGHLRRQRDAREKVTDVEAPWRRDEDRKDLEAHGLVETQQPGQPVATRQPQSRLLAADRHHRDDRHALVDGQPDEAAAPAEVDLRALPARAVNLPIPTGEYEDRRAGLERLASVLVRGRDGAEAAEVGPEGRGEDEVVRELVEA